MQRPSASLTLAVALCAAACPGHASSVTSTTLSDFRIAVVDLDPGDGIAATATLDPLAQSTVLAGLASPGASTFWTSQGVGAFGAASVSGILDGTGTGGAAAISGDALGAGATLATSAVGASDWGDGVGETYVGNGQAELTLTPHSQVSFSGLAAVAWQAGDPLAVTWGGVDLDFFLDSALVDRDEFSAGYGTPTTSPPGGQVGTASQAVAISFSNTSDAAVVLSFAVNVNADASEVEVVASPVSEPGGAALLLAGALPAWLALRRRHRR
jgi:hypothetical protein